MLRLEISSRSACGPKVDLALRQRGQLPVGCPLLIERLLQNTGAIVAARLLRPRDQAAVARDLVVFGGLGGVDQCRIQHRLVRDRVSAIEHSSAADREVVPGSGKTSRGNIGTSRKMERPHGRYQETSRLESRA